MDVSVVAEALHQLHSPLTSPRVRRRADSVLQQFQRSPAAIGTALRVLQAPITENGDAQLKSERAFAASTIYFSVYSFVRKTKLEDIAHWSDQERQQHELITKEFGIVCQQVWNVLTGPNATLEEVNVQTHLALTVAVIMLRFHEQHSEATLVAAVEWLVNNQNQPVSDGLVNSNVTNFAVLLTLKVIPEEVQNKRVKFTKMKRAQCEVMVQHSAPYVVQTVLPSLALAIDSHESQARLRGLLLKCCSSWIEYGNVPPALIMESGFLDRAFKETMVASCSEDALLLIREVVRACNNDAHVPLMELVMKNFVVLGKHIVAAPDDLKFCVPGTAVAIAECGQSFIMYFVDYTLNLQPGSLVYDFLETILYFTAFNDLDISNETMEFWIDFRSYISGKNERRMQDFEAFISRLLSILVERTEYPEGFEQFSAGAKERFAMYRNDVRAVFRSLATVNAASEDKFVVDAVHVIFRQYEQADAGQLTETWWKRTEVYVHALSALSKSIREEDTSIIPRLFDCLSRKEPSHRALLRTIAVFLGVSGQWFARNPRFLDLFAFPILSQSFEHSEDHAVFPFKMRGQEDHVGAVSLMKLTTRCGAHFFNQRWIDSMLYLYRLNRSLAGTKEARLVGNSLKLVVVSIANVAATVSYKEAFPVVDQLCAIMFDDMATKFTQVSPDDDEMAEFLVEFFDHLHVLAAKLPPQIDQEIPHPLLCVLQSRWDVLDPILQTFCANDDVMEQFCLMIASLFESIRMQALAFAAVIMPHLLEQFTRSHNGNLMKVIKSIISCAGDDDESIASLTRVILIIVESALSKVAATGNVDENASMIVSLLDLVGSCGSHRPLILVQSNQLESLLALVLHTLKAQTPELGIATLDFLSQIGYWYGEVLRTPPDLLKSAEWQGKIMLHELIRTLFFDKDMQYHLIVALFNAAGGAMPPNVLERISEVVRSCWTFFGRSRSEELISRLLQDNGFLGSHVSDRARGEFASTISKSECIDNPRKFRRVLGAFCDHFRKNLNGNASVAT